MTIRPIDIALIPVGLVAIGVTYLHVILVNFWNRNHRWTPYEHP